MFSVDLIDSLGVPVVAGAALTLTPVRYSQHALGGMETAEITVSGDRDGLWGTLAWLGLRVVIRNENSTPVWWGWIDEVSVGMGATSVGLSLRSMTNCVSVRYSQRSGSVAASAKTSPVKNDESIARYGLKELVLSIGESTQSQAELRRDLALAQSGRPVALLSLDGAENGVTLRCSGDWQRLDWRYYQQLAGYEAHNVSGNEDVLLTNIASSQKVAQSLRLAAISSSTVNQVLVRLAKVGTPLDGVKLAICSDAAGYPGAELQSATVAAAAIPGGKGWVTFQFPNTLVLNPATTYWLVINRTAVSNDAVNSYKIDVDSGGSYANGGLMLWGGAWGTLQPKDIPFQVVGSWEVTRQLEAIANYCGMNGVDLLATSGLTTCPYSDGARTGRDVAEGLLASGVLAGGRLLAEVTMDRTLRIRAQLSAPRVAWQLRGRTLCDEFGLPLEMGLLAAGHWVQLADVPAHLNVLADVRTFFIEWAEYTVASNDLRLQPSGNDGAWDVGGVWAG